MNSQIQHPKLAKLVDMLTAAGCELKLMPIARQYFIVIKPAIVVVSLDRGLIVLQKDRITIRQSSDEAEKTLKKWLKIRYTS